MYKSKINSQKYIYILEQTTMNINSKAKNLIVINMYTLKNRVSKYKMKILKEFEKQFNNVSWQLQYLLSITEMDRRLIKK